MKINDKGQIDVDEDDVKIREYFWKSRLAELKAVRDE